MKEAVERPKGMSQLDYLWIYFGNYAVQKGNIDPEYAIPTEEQINQKLQDFGVYWEEDEES